MFETTSNLEFTSHTSSENHLRVTDEQGRVTATADHYIGGPSNGNYRISYIRTLGSNGENCLWNVVKLTGQEPVVHKAIFGTGSLENLRLSAIEGGASPLGDFREVLEKFNMLTPTEEVKKSFADNGALDLFNLFDGIRSQIK